MEQLRLQSAAIGSVNYAVCVTDPEGRLQWMNEAYAELMGAPTNELLGEPLASFPHEHLQMATDHSLGSPKSVEVLKTEIIEERAEQDDDRPLLATTSLRSQTHQDLKHTPPSPPQSPPDDEEEFGEPLGGQMPGDTMAYPCGKPEE